MQSEIQEKNKIIKLIKESKTLDFKAEAFLMLLFDRISSGKILTTPTVLGSVFENVQLLKMIPTAEKQTVQILIDTSGTYHINKNKPVIKPKDVLEDADIILEPTMRKIRQLLHNHNLEGDVSISRFVDNEYPDWQEIKLDIKIKKDLNYIYQKLKAPIYHVVFNTVPKELLPNIIVKFHVL
jgi:hypothetical protein